MITIFNRAELIITYDMKKQADVRNILSANNIPYIIKTRNLTSTGIGNANTRTRAGSFGVNTDSSYEYKIYVKKNDLEQAKYLIR